MKNGLFESAELLAVSAVTPKNRINLADYNKRYGEDLQIDDFLKNNMLD